MKNTFLWTMVLAVAGSVSALAQAPQYVLSYFINPNGTQKGLIPDPLVFPPTNVGTTVTATVVILNSGSGNGQVNSITLSGNTFLLSGLPTFPKTIQPNANVTFIVSFTPTSHGQATGIITLNFDTGPQTINVSGTGVGASFLVESLTPGVVLSNGTLSFPNTPVGNSVSATVRVTNNGDAAGSITPTVIGSNFALTNVIPQQLTLSPNASTAFNVVFTPTDIGPLTAQLLISSTITINLAGTGQGSRLTFTVGSQAIANGGTIFFPNTVVGSTAALALTITNTGNLATSLTSVGVKASAFSISGSLTLPITLPPNGTTTIGLLFSPNAVGTLLSILSIDSQAFNLQGVGSAPTALPGVSFTGVGDTAAPLQQPSVGVHLAAPYAQDVTGTLTLTFTPDSFVDDPTIQFASGGRTVNFTIPATKVDAVFGSAAQVLFSSGTVSGVITLTPTFAIGTVDLTPKPATVKTVLVAASAPVLKNLQIGVRTATSFELLITGYSTPRSVSGLQLNFTPSAGSTLATSSIPVNSDSAFSAWYQTAASQTVGSQFTASVTITLSGNATAVQSVSVSASNSRGTSTPVSVNLQ